MTLTISPFKTVRGFSLIVLFLILAGLSGQLSKYLLGHDHLLGFVPEFDLNGENNIPTWYASSSLLVCSVLLAAIALAKKRDGAPYALHWAVMSVIFVGLSIDEAASLHELLTRDFGFGSGVFFYVWVIPGTAFVLVFVLSYLRFLRHLPEGTRNLFLVAGALYVGGALVIEAVEGLYVGSHDEDLILALIRHAQESLEMLGIVVFIYALLSYMKSHVKELHLRIE